jgi:hypothetical protein
MLDPLTPYLSGNYLKFYIGPFLLWLVIVLVATSYDHDEYLGLVPLSYVATFSLFGLVQHLTSNHDFETLQCYGVSFGRLAVPVLVATLTLQASTSAFAVVASNDRPRAIAYAVWTFLAVLACCVLTLKTIWGERDAALVRACLRGFAAQTTVLLVWGIASFLYGLAHTR